MRRERGGATVELVLVTPLLLLLALLAIAGGRLVEARADVDGAARDAARAASLRHDVPSATKAATAIAQASLGGPGASCRHLDVVTETAELRPGGWVAVRVTCAVDLAEVAALRLPGSTMVSARVVEPVDAFRSAP